MQATARKVVDADLRRHDDGAWLVRQLPQQLLGVDLAYDRQPTNPDGVIRYSHHRTTVECILNSVPDALQQRRERGRVKTFLPDTYH